MKSTLAILSCVASVVVSVVIPAVAFAKPKVALTEITNDTGDEVRDAISDALDHGEVTVLGSKEVNRAYDKLKVENELTEKDAKKLAKTLEADAVIHGTLGRQGGSRTLHLQLFIHGKKAKGFTVSFGNAKSEKFKTSVRNKLVAKIGGTDDAGPAPDEDDDAGSKKNKSKKLTSGDDDSGDDTVQNKKRKASSADDDDGDGAPTKKKKKKVARGEGDEGDDEADEMTIRAPSSHSANRVAVRLDAGVSVANRTLDFTSRANFANAPKPFSSKPVPGARIEAEMYPLAFANPTSPAAGLGFGFDYDQTLSLTLHASQEMSVPVKTTQRRWSIGPRYRLAFGKTTMSPTMTISVNYGKRTFTTDRSALADPAELDLPDTNYTVIDPGLAFRIPLAPNIAITLGGAALLITDAGPIQSGDSYGRAKVYGGSGMAAFDIVLGNRFAIRLSGEFAQIGFTFTGGGALTNNRDMDPSTADIGGATDRTIGGALTLGVLY